MMSFSFLFHAHAICLSVESIFPQSQILSISASLVVVCSQNDYCVLCCLVKNKWYKEATAHLACPCAVFS